MPLYKRFEELPIWIDAVALYKVVYTLTNKGELARDYDMKSQIRRAAASVSNNIAEGFEQNNNRAFLSYLRIAKGSVGEIRNQAYLIHSVGLLPKQDFDELTNIAISISQQIANFMKYLRTVEPKKTVK